MNIQYTGKIKIKYLVNGKEVTYKTHNEGLNAMFKYICKVLSGNITNISADRPAYADIRAVYSDPDEGIVEKSCLYNTLSLSDPEYYYDTDLKTWAARFNIVISYTMLNFDMIDAHPQATYYIYLMSQSKNDFARLTLDSKKISLKEIIPGTQAIVEWTMIVENSKNTESES